MIGGGDDRLGRLVTQATIGMATTMPHRPTQFTLLIAIAHPPEVVPPSLPPYLSRHAYPIPPPALPRRHPGRPRGGGDQEARAGASCGGLERAQADRAIRRLDRGDA